MGDSNDARDDNPISLRRLRDADELLARERDARRELEHEKTVRERLLAMMTTEMVTQANVALGWLGLMRREHLDTIAREKAFAKITAALNAQLAMLDDLVGMSPAAAGHVNVDCRSCNLAEIVRAVASDAGDHRVRVIASEGAIVVADIEHVVRALGSLISATTRADDFVEVDVCVAGDSVLVRFSNVVHDDAALSVARRVAALYGGTISLAEDQTVFALPVAGSGSG